jgi:hypothetical protein
MVKGKTLDQLRVSSHAVLHLHNLNHVQVGFSGGLVDGKDGIDNVRGELGCQCRVELRGKRCTRDVEEEFSVDVLGKLERVKELAKRQYLAIM